MTWKARFAPPALGEWTFESRSEDPGLNGVTGKLTCTAWTEDEKQAILGDNAERLLAELGA